MSNITRLRAVALICLMQLSMHTFANEPSSTLGFQGVLWGSTKDEVREKFDIKVSQDAATKILCEMPESKKFHLRIDKECVFYRAPVTVANIQGEGKFYFSQGGGLVQVSVTQPLQALALAQSSYTKTLTLLKSVYGDPSLKETRSVEDMTAVFSDSEWAFPGTTVQVQYVSLLNINQANTTVTFSATPWLKRLKQLR